MQEKPQEKLQIKLDLNNALQVKAFRFAMSLCTYSQKDNAFLADFWNRLIEQEDIFEEFCYFLEHQDYLCKAKTAGYSIVDIMVWEINHFKAQLDRDTAAAMKENGDLMLLTAFDTMSQMRQNPAPYLEAMKYETGTDYVGKY